MGGFKRLQAGMPVPHRVQPRGRTRGMAVVSVLLIVAVIALLAAALMARQATAIRSAQTEQTRIQAHWLLRGEISRAQVLLRGQAQRTPVVRLDDAWARPVAGAAAGELEGHPARLYSEIADEQAKFNLRNLVQAGQVDPGESAAFLRLCELAGVPRSQAGLIARRAVASLVEADGPPAPAAAADAQARAARSAALALGIDVLNPREQAPRLRELGDLLGTPGIDPASVARLRPYVTVLPQRTWINANTAGPEVLAAWVPGLSMERARAMLEARDQGQWFINRGDFANRLQMPGIDETEILIGITSQWFHVSSALRTPRTTLLMQALLHDDKESLPQVAWLREGA